MLYEVITGAPTVLSGANCAEILVPKAWKSTVWPRLKKDELALPSKSTSMSYQRPPTVTESRSVRSVITSYSIHYTKLYDKR